MEPLAHSFNLESYKQIRAEVAVLLTRIENLFRYSLVVMATVFAWLVTQAFGLTESGVTCLKLPREVLAQHGLFYQPLLSSAGCLPWLRMFEFSKWATTWRNARLRWVCQS